MVTGTRHSPKKSCVLSARNRPVISFEAVQQTRGAVRPVQDRIVYKIDVAQNSAVASNRREHIGDVDELAESIQAFDLLQPGRRTPARPGPV